MQQDVEINSSFPPLNSGAASTKSLESPLRFEARTRQALAGDPLACWTVVWQCLHENSREISAKINGVKHAIHKVEVEYYDDDVNKVSDDILHLIKGALIYAKIYNSSLCSSLADSSEREWMRCKEALRHFQLVTEDEESIVYLQALILQGLMYKRGELEITGDDPQALFNAQDRVIMSILDSRNVESKLCKQILDDYIRAMRLPDQDSPLPYEVLAQIHRLYYGSYYGFNPKQQDFYEQNKHQSYAARYHNAIATAINSREKAFLKELVNEDADNLLAYLLNDELLSINKCADFLKDLWPAATMSRGKNALKPQSHLDLVTFLVMHATYCSIEKSLHQVEEIFAPVKIRIDLLKQWNFPEAAEFEVQWAVAQVKMVVLGQVNPQEKVVFACRNLLSYTSSLDALIVLTRLLLSIESRKVLREAFPDDVALRKLIMSLMSRAPVSLQSQVGFKQYCGGLMQHFSPNLVDPALSSNVNYEQYYSVYKAAVEAMSAAERQENFIRLNYYLEYCENISKIREESPVVLSFSQHLRKLPLREALCAAAKITDLPVIGNALRNEHSQNARKTEAKHHQHLLNCCVTPRASLTFTQCVRQFLRYLRDDITQLHKGSIAYCLMEQLAPMIDLDFQRLVEQQKDPVNIRNSFCGLLESKFCATSLSIAYPGYSSTNTSTIKF
jgi:hypothetical protein